MIHSSLGGKILVPRGFLELSLLMLENTKAGFLALNPACSSHPGEKSRQEGNCTDKSEITTESYPS